MSLKTGEREILKVWLTCAPLCSRSFPQINIYVYLLTFVLYKLVLGRFVLNVLERLGSRNEMARELEK